MICMNLIFDLLLEIQCSIKMLSNLFHKFTTVSEKFGYDFNIGTQAFTKQCVIIWHQPFSTLKSEIIYTETETIGKICRNNTKIIKT